MLVYNLKKVLVILLIALSASSVKAQQIHFIYLQAENGQPFYVKLNHKVVSSSAVGYLILPNLIDSVYQLVIGFPKNEFPEEGFDISIDKKNEGFLLKNFGEKGWSLFNLQTLAVLPGNSAANTNTVVVDTAKMQNDPFSKMLANVVKDSSILQKIEPVVATKDTSALQNNVVVADTSVNHADMQPAAAPSAITKLLSKNDQEGIQRVYIDNNDTVRVFIPSENLGIKKSEEKAIAENKNLNQLPDSSLVTSTAASRPHEDTITIVNDTLKVYKELVKSKNVEIKDSSISKNNQEQPAMIAEPVPVRKHRKPAIKDDNEIIILPKAVTSSRSNSDCKAFATDEDFLKLRKKMTAENSNDAMIQAAKKVFRSKCFSTEQIRNLSYLFLNDEGKYMFYDAAYAYVSDSDQYQILASQLTDEYYINRFKAMIHQ
ncbi:MAG: DUF4476 domain-containing protein [Bacteroidota bacterium]|nr:DUF4476 domain-containing protein [Bacteroidota bacterium]